jgi:hypothetical protein
MNYTDYVATIVNLIPTTTTDPNFVQILPSTINDAELRINRDFDFLSTVVQDSSGTLTPNSRYFTFPQQFVVSESINVFTPAGGHDFISPLVPVSLEWMDAVWGVHIATTTPSVPQYYAMVNDQTIVVGPPPDAAYLVQVTGTIRPAPLSASNSTTYISLNFSDMMISASMIYIAGWMKNYGAAVDDPQQGVSWEQHYGKQFASANVEEARKKYASQAWTSKQPYAVSTPART